MGMEKIRILVIDNETEILEMLSLIFSFEPDMEAFTLSDVLHWREAIERFHPSIVLVDYRMPAMSGESLIQALNASGLRSSIQVVALFSATPFSPAEIQKIGADVFFEKPFDIKNLVSSLRSLMRREVLNLGALA